MSHSHSHGSRGKGRAFAIGILLNSVFVIVEVICGLMMNSLALLADAGHNLIDVLGLLLAWGATAMARRLPTARRTYGLRRSTILAALLNAVLLLIAVGGIGWEAMRRLQSPEPPPDAAIIWVALIGIVVNGSTALLFLKDRHHDVNVRGAYLHMMADTAVSLGVVVAGIAIVLTDWKWIDPAVGIGIALVILVGTWGLLRESLDLATDAVPSNIDPTLVHDYLSKVPNMKSLHDLHIWALSTTETALTAHLVMVEPFELNVVLHRIGKELHDQFGLEHVTLQIEQASDGRCPCGSSCSSG